MKQAVLYVQPYGIGNTILSTPAMQAIRTVFSSARYELLISTIGREVVEGWTLFDRIYSDVAEIQSDAVFDLAVLAEPQSDQFYAGIEGRVREVARHAGSNYRTRTLRPRLKHETVINMETAQRLGYSGEYPPLYVRTAADSTDYDIHRGKIAIHMGSSASGLAAKKKWLPERWMELIRRLGPERVVIVGGPDEMAAAAAVARETGARHTCGAGSVPATARLIANSRLLVSIDSGPMHVAAAVGTPVVALFGGTSVRKNHPWTPHGKSLVLRSAVICGPCQFTPRYKTCDDFVCMESIPVARVLDAVAAIEQPGFRTLTEPRMRQDTACREGDVLDLAYDVFDEAVSRAKRWVG